MSCCKCPWDYEKYVCLGCYAKCSDGEEIQTDTCYCWGCGYTSNTLIKYARHVTQEHTVCCLGPCCITCGQESQKDLKENRVYVTARDWSFCAPGTLIEKRETSSKIILNVRAPCCGMSKETKVTPIQEALPTG